jgi:pimeloyl-ACP methyl ester carboxylesterase
VGAKPLWLGAAISACLGHQRYVKHLTVNASFDRQCVGIAYLDEGKGPCVTVGHCSSASHKEWLPLIETLTDDWRVLAPDFIGYGQSDPWPLDKPFSTEADVNVILGLAKKTKSPPHLVGHSYGAALALEAARML